MKSTKIVAALLSTLLVVPVVVAQEHDAEHLIIEMANTPDEHRAVARHYMIKADEARQQARRHESMGRLYAGQRSAQPQRGRQHCEALAKNYEAIATEFEELAKLHEEQANGAR